MPRSSGYQKVGLRIDVSGFAPILNQYAPFEQNIFGHLEDALLEHRAHTGVKPPVEVRALYRVSYKFDAKAYLGQRDGAYVQQIERLVGDKRSDAWFRSWALQLG